MPRPPRPDDLYRLRIATEPALSPDGRWVVVTLQTVAPGFDGYRHALWLVPTDPAADGEARQLTLGAQKVHHPRFSADGRRLAFLSDRRPFLEDGPARPAKVREPQDTIQVHLLPLDAPGGEAHRLTDLPRGVKSFEWSPDGRRLVVVSASLRGRDEVKRSTIGEPPVSDHRFIDRLEYMLNGEGFIYDRVTHLWMVDVETGTASRLTDGPVSDVEPSWSPDGSRIAFAANRGRNPDLAFRQRIFVVDVATRRVTAVTGGQRSVFGHPTFMPDGGSIAVLGHRRAGRAGSRSDLWLFAADGSEARATGGRNLSGRHDLMPGSTMNSDVTRGETARLWPSPDGRSITFAAPVDGSYELWRIETAEGGLARLTTGRHYLSGWDATLGQRGRIRLAYLRSSPTEPPDVWLQDGTGEARRLTSFNADVLADLTLREPVERHVTVDGRDIAGWLIQAGDGARPTVTQIHGGPHTLYGWSPIWEFQVLAGIGISVFYSNPRGSEGYGQDFNDANHRDWGPGPMRDVLAGVDALIEDGLADRDRLGLTGGSYGGYLTNWIVAHDDRFTAAMTCRSVSDMAMLFMTGDISGGDWGIQEFDATPWSDPSYYREISPLTYAAGITTPLLIQHSENDIRTTVGQAEALFTVLRSLRRPVRLLRVPEETHELTRSGTPFRRIANLEIVLAWFRYFLVEAKTGLPPIRRPRAER